MKRSFKVQAFIFFAILIPILFGCEKGTWQKHERHQIKEYIDSLGDTAYVLKPSGLYYIELTAGTGRTPVAKDTVYFKYKGCFLDGTSFISNLTDTVPFKHVVGVDKIVAGLDEGLRYMKEGGKARLVLPSSLAYGAEGWWGVIPGYTPLFWEIDLITVKAGPGK
jgi:FKBP-type peptidyl-prolyl cis-trans isomerase